MMPAEQLPEAGQQLRRLCSEIQLFDLCDLERCGYKQGRFCTRTELLARFEQIADEDESAPLRNATEDGSDEDEELDGYGSDYDEGEFDGEDD
jgi:hypothetical protein